MSSYLAALIFMLILFVCFVISIFLIKAILWLWETDILILKILIISFMLFGFYGMCYIAVL